MISLAYFNLLTWNDNHFVISATIALLHFPSYQAMVYSETLIYPLNKNKIGTVPVLNVNLI